MVIETRDRLTAGSNRVERVLSLEIRSRFFGFAVFESGQIVDWGVRGFASGSAGRRVAVKKFATLVKLYVPSVVVARQTRRARQESSKSSQGVVRAFRRESEFRSTEFVMLDRSEVREVFARIGMNNKQARALFIVERFTPLKSKLPRARRKWEPERQIFTVFDAVATEIAYEARAGPRVGTALGRHPRLLG